MKHIKFQSLSGSLRAFTLLILFISVGLSIAAQDHDVPVSVDGIRCDSCGSECSVMCGSRNFRACCYNYIKKRSIPWQGVDNDDVVHDGRSGPSDLKSNSGKTPVVLKHLPSPPTGVKHVYGGYVPDIVNMGGESLEDGEILFPVRFRDLIGSMVRAMNVYDSRKRANLMLQ